MKSLHFLLCVPFLVTALAAQPQEEQQEAALTACRANIKNLATAVEMYQLEHDGRATLVISELLPRYLPVPVHCPVGGESYSLAEGAAPEELIVSCSADHTPLVPTGFPRYSSLEGFLRP